MSFRTLSSEIYRVTHLEATLSLDLRGDGFAAYHQRLANESGYKKRVTPSAHCLLHLSAVVTARLFLKSWGERLGSFLSPNPPIKNSLRGVVRFISLDSPSF